VNPIELFERWEAFWDEEFVSHGVKRTKSGNWSSRASQEVFVDLECPDASARATIWPEGKAELEIVRTIDSSAVYYKITKTLTESDLDEWYASFGDYTE
jgi:hypothetical protein